MEENKTGVLLLLLGYVVPIFFRWQHEAAVRELEQVATDADREFQAREAAFRGREVHLEETLKAR